MDGWIKSGPALSLFEHTTWKWKQILCVARCAQSWRRHPSGKTQSTLRTLYNKASTAGEDFSTDCSAEIKCGLWSVRADGETASSARDCRRWLSVLRRSVWGAEVHLCPLSRSFSCCSLRGMSLCGRNSEKVHRWVEKQGCDFKMKRSLRKRHWRKMIKNMTAEFSSRAKESIPGGEKNASNASKQQARVGSVVAGSSGSTQMS